MERDMFLHVPILIFLIAILSFQPAFAYKNRVALVIGNSDYEVSHLKNPVNDANSMSTALRTMRFKVIKGINLNRKAMHVKIREFGNELKTADVGLFYFAGHGIQYEGQNYLIPVKANIEHEDEVKFESINAASVLEKMESAQSKVNIVILDACRNNPFARSYRSATRGLTRIDGTKGSIIAFATEPGSVAADGEGRNGLYTENLLKYMKEPIPLEKVFKKVRMAVSNATGDKQIPWENSSLVGADFYFVNEIKKTGHLTIRSNMNGCSVIINGESKGSTDLGLDLIPGIYYVEVTKNGYQSFEQYYTIKAGTEQFLYAKLKEVSQNKVESNYQPTQEEKYTDEQRRAIELFNKM